MLMIKVQEINLSQTNQTFVKWLLKEYDFNDFCKLQEVCKAYTLDKETLTKVTDKILIDNGAEEVK